MNVKSESIVRATVPALGEFLRSRALLAAGTLASAILLGSIAVLVQRRLAGVLVDPLAAGAFLGVALLLVPLAGAAAVTLDYLFAPRARSARAMKLALAVLTLAGLLSIAVPGTSAWALLAGAVAWLAASTIVLGNERISQWVRSARRWIPSARIKKRGARKSFDGGSIGARADERGILQRFVRRQISTDGAERIDGSLRCEFAPGQRSAMAHVAFCPPLPALPKIEVRLSASPTIDGICKVAELYAHAARFEVRLAAPARAVTVTRVEFSAISEPLPARVEEGIADGTVCRHELN
ncbi:MAG: hypothetical protein K2Y37_07330 [Pirellulales bacterium]|nr:hypothetical protein [Pirellulales bacterium]